MALRVGIENNCEGIRTLAWALEHPGCYAYGLDEQEAVRNLPAALDAYSAWTAGHGGPRLGPDAAGPVVEDVFDAYLVDESFERAENGEIEINAWFQHDWKPLTPAEIERGLQIMDWARQDLLAVLQPLTPEQWALKAPGERWGVARIVQHIAGSEWWYMDRLGLAFPRAELPDEPLAGIQKSLAHLRAVLPALAGVDKVVGTDGEFWSPRKMLRRTAWHERDHTEHIQKVLAAAQ
jgi:hypothetical protein